MDSKDINSSNFIKNIIELVYIKFNELNDKVKEEFAILMNHLRDNPLDFTIKKEVFDTRRKNKLNTCQTNEIYNICKNIESTIKDLTVKTYLLMKKLSKN